MNEVSDRMERKTVLDLQRTTAAARVVEDLPERLRAERGRRMTRRARRVLILVILLGLAATLKLTLFRPQKVPVTVYRAAAGRVEEIVTNSKAGTVESRRRATLSPETGGRVAEIPVAEGDHVHKGDLLVRVADADYRAQLELQERSLEAAVAAETEVRESLALAERELERTRRLTAEGIVSEGAFDIASTHRERAAATLEAAHARVQQARAAAELARVSLAKTELRAPFDGVVAEISTEVGEWITPSPPGIPMPPVVELIDPGDVYVSVALDEVDVATVRPGQLVRITMDSHPGKSFPGRVTRVAPYVADVQQQNRTFETEVVFDDPGSINGLLPGTSADVAVILDAHDGVLRVPSYALMEGNRVMVVKDERLATAPVKIGLRNWEFTEITAGLATGDLVAVSIDRPDVKEGARVRIAGETAK